MEVQPKSGVLQFGEFELDVRNYRLRRSEEELKLERIPMELLILLASRPGDLIRREEIVQKLWGDDINVDTENAINTAVRKIRQVLGDDSSNPRFVQTISKRGYRFLAQATQPASPAQPPAPALKAIRVTRAWQFLAGTAALFCISLVFWSLIRSGQVMQVSHYQPITHDGEPKQGPLLSDGVRIYFVSGTMNQRRISEISINGGELSTLASRLESPRLLDLSPNKGELLVTSFGPHPDLSIGEGKGLKESMLWSISLPSGTARRVGDAIADAAAFSPDGQKIAIGWNDGLSLVNSDGTNQRTLTRLPGAISAIRWSPDGRRLRMTVMSATTLHTSLWEVAANGTSPHEVLGGSNPSPAECCGLWSPDGRWYIFQSTRDGKTDIWVLPESSGLIGRRTHSPSQLTAGQINSLAPEMSPDGSRLFIIGQQLRGELDRYDARLKQFVPYLNGISAEFLDFSRDGKWLAYVSFPDHLLWRCDVHGEQCLQLTQPAMQPAAPRWSPDSTRLAFFDTSPGKPFKLFVVPANGGSPAAVVDQPWNEIDPNWSPDGHTLVFSHFHTFDRQPELGIYSIDLDTHRLIKLPRSDGLWMPRWSPDGAFILARSADSLSLLMFNKHTQKWNVLADGESFGYANWSSDGKFVYVLKRGNEPAIERIRISDGKTEIVASLAGVRQTGFRGAIWTGLAPNDDPLILRDTGSEELYSLDTTVH
ncbi:winged helix-turn-helix transcriptional regulator [Acidicapsa acidisoli]|uniref:winged helix-turn-helix transcriptional regulator n=1 Tax=Acidicapsa acidisoli TaxID=1615681 RepID=UPI0021DFE622|nr:winged helix-turn-helix transcriptional regulator [Acidicapsa acidisoli]